MTELSLFAYPWDAKETGVDTFVTAVADLGVDRVYVATRYHTAEVITPRGGGAAFANADEDGYYFPLSPGTFTSLAPARTSVAGFDPGFYSELAESARRRGLRLGAWIVGLHASRLAGANPQAAIENCFGDRSGHFLCPANPACARYLDELVNATLAAGLFDVAFLENFSYGLVGHGHPHELHGVRLDPACRYLASLCFCPSCMEEGAKRRLDGPRLRAYVAHELRRTWNGPLATTWDDDEGAELGSLLATNPDLAGWARMRCEVVTALARSIVERAHGHGAAAYVSAAIWGRPAYFNWTEGVDLAATATFADRIVIESYHRSAAEIARELDHVLAMASPDKIVSVLLLWPKYLASLPDLLAKVDLARAAGIGDFGFYNWSTAPEPMLNWIGATARHLRDG